MVTSRNPDQTKASILAAATSEFVTKGLAGARVDEIARLAGANKRMIYHYFGDKSALYQAVLGNALSAMSQTTHSDSAESPFAVVSLALPEDLARLLAWDGLSNDSGMNDPQSGPWSQWLTQIRRAQDEGVIAPVFDPGQLTLALLAIAAFPHICPDIAQAMTGEAPDSTEFSAAQHGLVHALEKVLRSQPGDAKKPRVKLKPTISPS